MDLLRPGESAQRHAADADADAGGDPGGERGARPPGGAAGLEVVVAAGVHEEGIALVVEELAVPLPAGGAAEVPEALEVAVWKAVEGGSVLKRVLFLNAPTTDVPHRHQRRRVGHPCPSDSCTTTRWTTSPNSSPGRRGCHLLHQTGWGVLAPVTR